jgi:SAM-dependent methyltransferase
MTRLRVRLPAFKEFLDRDPPRRNRLTIDGEERVLSPSQSGTVLVVDHPAEGESAELELSFWPVSYSNTFRKRTVPLRRGQTVTVDLTKADPQRPDHHEAIYFPTPPVLTEAMIRLAGVGKDDDVLDIGCGDGRLVISAVKDHGAKSGVGVDIRQELVDLCRDKAREAGVADRCQFRVEDALKMTDLSPYSVVFLYLGEDLTERLRPLLQKTLRPGARVVSNTFRAGEWKPDEVKKVKCLNNYDKEQEFTLYLWRLK